MKQNEKKEQLTVNIQYIKDLSFENQNSPDSLSNKGEAPAINVDVNVFAPTSEFITYSYLSDAANI